MKYTKLGTSDLNVSRIVLGCMRIADKPLERTERLLEAAVGAGVNMFDHSISTGEAKASGCSVWR